MSKPRLLIVEDDADISAMLSLYFSSLNYDVARASRGSEALEQTRQRLPHLIILDIMLPDLDGFEICRILRTQARTSHIPVIFLTQKDERSNKIQGLELGADDYITKPFDIEELRLRVQNAITRSERERLTDPHTNLPSGRLIEDQLRKVIHNPGWAFMDLRVNDFESYKDVYGFVAADNVLRYLAILLGEVVDESGSPEDFIGHTGNDHFVILTSDQKAGAIREQLKARFAEEIVTHYSFLDRQRGYTEVMNGNGQVVRKPLMTLSIGIVSPREYPFTDIREITELAAELRRKDRSN